MINGDFSIVEMKWMLPVAKHFSIGQQLEDTDETQAHVIAFLHSANLFWFDIHGIFDVNR